MDRWISPAEAYRKATPQQRAWWFKQGPPLGKEAIPYTDHGHGAGWGTSPAAGGRRANPAELMETLSTLDDQARSIEAQWVGRMVDDTLADLTGWALGQPRYDPHAPLPLSQAERRRRELVDADTIRSWRD